MKRADGRRERHRLCRGIAVLGAVAATFLLDVQVTQSRAMTEIDDLTRKIELDTNSENQIRYAYQIQRLVCDMDPTEVSEELIDQLIGLAHNANELVRTNSARALLCIGRPAKRAIPALEEAVAMAPRREGWVAPSSTGTHVIIYVLQELNRMQ